MEEPVGTEPGEVLLEVIGQTVDVVLELAVGLDRHGCHVAPAVADAEPAAAWGGARPEARAAVLLTAAWGSREHDLEAPADGVGRYAAELHALARQHAGDPDGYRFAWGADLDPDAPGPDADLAAGLRAYLRHDRGTAELPFDRAAGALARRLGSDGEEPATGLGVALVLLAPVRRAAAAAS